MHALPLVALHFNYCFLNLSVQLNALNDLLEIDFMGRLIGNFDGPKLFLIPDDSTHVCRFRRFRTQTTRK